MSQYADPPDFVAIGVSDTLKQVACVKASGLADSYLAKRFKLPLLAWGDDLRANTADLARYRCYSDRGFDPANPGDLLVVEAKKDAIAWFKLVSLGEVEPQGIVDSTPSTSEAAPLVESDEPLNWQWPSSSCEDE